MISQYNDRMMTFYVRIIRLLNLIQFVFDTLDRNIQRNMYINQLNNHMYHDQSSHVPFHYLLLQVDHLWMDIRFPIFINIILLLCMLVFSFMMLSKIYMVFFFLVLLTLQSGPRKPSSHLHPYWYLASHAVSYSAVTSCVVSYGL